MRVNEDRRKIVHTVKRGKANWICYILLGYCLLKHVMEGKIEGRIEVMGRQGRRCRQILDECNEKRGYCKLTEEALDGTGWRTGFGKGPWARRQAD